MNWILVDYTGSNNQVRTGEKNQDPQTRNFKLKNVINHVQIDRRKGSNLSLL